MHDATVTLFGDAGTDPNDGSADPGYSDTPGDAHTGDDYYYTWWDNDYEEEVIPAVSELNQVRGGETGDAVYVSNNQYPMLSFFFCG